jgi:hypothetical protein
MCVDYCLRHWIVQDKKLKAVGRDPLVINETLIQARRLVVCLSYTQVLNSRGI